jgi:hypothetical protein
MPTYTLKTLSNVMSAAANHLSKHSKPNSRRSQIGTDELRTQSGTVYVDMKEVERLARVEITDLADAKKTELTDIKFKLKAQQKDLKDPTQ